MKIELPNKMKTVLGIGLVLLAIAAIFFWEAEGREQLLMDPVLIAEDNIKAGEILNENMFRTVSAPVETLVDGAVDPADLSQLTKMEAAVDIVKGAQLSVRYIRDKYAVLKPETSYFTIRNEWIYMCSSSIRRDDRVLISSSDGKTILGSFPVAFVKDSDGREVTDASSGMYSFTGTGGESERIHTTAPIHHVEIECELKDYQRILDFCAGKAGESLMLIREMCHGF